VQTKAGAWYDILMVGIESDKNRRPRWGTYSVGICDNTWKRMGEVTPGRYEHATRWSRETRVADDLEERQ
jgi:hypothetical protein